MYNNGNNASQYPSSGYQYPQYSQEYPGSYNYQGYEHYSTQAPPQLPPPISHQENYPAGNWTTYKSSQKDAVVQEMEQQKAQLIRQREDYVQKASLLRNELEQLQLQKQDLVGNGGSVSKDLVNILQQNTKLQDEIHGKMKAIHNVIEMLSSIIKDGKSINDLEASLAVANSPASTQISSFTNYKSHSPEPEQKHHLENAYYVHYDTGLHWCRMCDEFPETAKDFLLHLQDKKHREMMKDNDVDNTPWHKVPPEPLLPSDENAPKKRIPIKGLQFFISAPSWYCKLCDVWIGDLHCASHHLKSKAHHQNYDNFVNQNPHWEMEWIKDREKSMSRKGANNSSDSDNARKRKRKEKLSGDALSIKDKKKKRKSKKKKTYSSDSSSSSSSSDSSSDDDDDKDDRSKSIRVAMRNTQKVQSIMDEDLSSKWNVLEKLVEEHKRSEKEKEREKEKRDTVTPGEDSLINQWMTVSQPPAKERMMLNSLKDRMRQKQEQIHARIADMEKIRREKERQELERLERKKREEQEAEEETRRIMKQKEQEEFERMKDRERHQIRFKPSTYRRIARSNSRSDDEDGSMDKFYKYDSYKKNEREDSYTSHHSRSRSRSHDNDRHEESASKKKPPGPPSYKKLPFIGRMPLFKNKNKMVQEEKDDPRELKKHSYEIPRKTRFEPGNLPKAFIPRPEVVCFPKLSSIPPLNVPPPPPTVTERLPIPQPPTMNPVAKRIAGMPKAPPPPKIEKKEPDVEIAANLSDDEVLYGSGAANPNMIGQYYQEYEIEAYQRNSYSYENLDSQPHSHSMPLQPPPLPPDDDLALLGICADDMAAQTF